MIRLEDYVMEATKDTTDGTTSSNKERKKELEEWLKNKKYPEYVDTLNKMLDDPKAKTLLKDGFGGDLGDTKFKFKVKLLKPLTLRPTQNEIDVDKSIKHALTKVDNIKNDFSDKIVIANMPLVTFRGNYVIDGHHRWAEGAMINPEGHMVCFDYDAEISPIQMLKAVQGNIAAALAERDEDPDIPSGKTAGPNLFDKEWNKEKIKDYVSNKITDEVVDELIKLKASNKSNYPIKFDDKEDVVGWLCDNIWNVKIDNYPEENSPSRGEMPQTDKAGKTKGDKRSSYPDEKGSALNRMKEEPFDKGAVK